MRISIYFPNNHAGEMAAAKLAICAKSLELADGAMFSSKNNFYNLTRIKSLMVEFIGDAHFLHVETNKYGLNVAHAVRNSTASAASVGLVAFVEPVIEDQEKKRIIDLSDEFTRKGKPVIHADITEFSIPNILKTLQKVLKKAKEIE